MNNILKSTISIFAFSLIVLPVAAAIQPKDSDVAANSQQPLTATIIEEEDIAVSNQTDPKNQQNEWKDIQTQAKHILKENNLYQQEEELLKNLLAIPYEKRQYFFPYLHEERYIPHKIKSHPQIIVWKGKKPTVIAPVMQEFAEKYLDDLPATFYYFLDPDYWEKPQAVEQNYITNAISLNMAETKVSTPEEVANATVRPLKESFVLPPQFKDNFYQTDLTAADIQNFKTTLADLSVFIDSYPEKEKIPSELRDSVHFYMREGIAEPFRIWANGVKQTKIAGDFEEFIKKHGWKTTDDFIQKADILLRAVRVNRMSIPQAISMSVLRQKYPLQEGEPITSAQMYYLMHEATPGDALFVAPYADELKKAFDSDNFIRYGLLIYID